MDSSIDFVLFCFSKFDISVKDEHVVRRMLDADILGKRTRGQPNLRGTDACKRDITEAWLKEDNIRNMAVWRNTRSPAIPATPDDGTS